MRIDHVRRARHQCRQILVLDRKKRFDLIWLDDLDVVNLVGHILSINADYEQIALLDLVKVRKQLAFRQATMGSNNCSLSFSAGRKR